MTKIEELTAIKNEILNGPLASTLTPYRSSGSDASIAAALNKEDILILSFLSSEKIYKYCYMKNLIDIWRFRTEYRSARIMADLEFKGYELGTIEGYNRFIYITDYMIAERLNPAMGAPTFTETDRQALLDLGKVYTSRAKIIGCNCSIQNIAEALRGGLV